MTDGTALTLIYALMAMLGGMGGFAFLLGFRGQA